MKFFSTRFLLFQLGAGVLALSFVSCGSDDDISEPVIEITKPSDNETIVPGTGNLIVEGTLSDNVALSLCTISLEYTDSETSSVAMNDDQTKSPSGDGDGTLKGVDDEPWTPDADEIQLSGETYEFEANYKPFGSGSVPADIKFGEYTLTIEVEDEAGNVATEEIVLDFSGE